MEIWHGQDIVDDYAWIERKGPDTNEWIDKQNRFARNYLESFPGRDKLKAEVKIWYDLEVMGLLKKRGDKLFQWRRKPGQNHSVLYTKDSETEVGEVVLDPNALSEDGTTAVDWTGPTKDGKLLAYGVSDGGTEKSVLKILNVETKQHLQDEIPNTREASLAWLPDNSGFYYTRYPEKGSVPEGEENYQRSIYFHQLGTDYKGDPFIFDSDDPHNDWPEVDISEDGQWIILSNSHGWTANDVWIAKKNKKDPLDLTFRSIFISKNDKLNVDILGNRLYMMTNYGAPRAKIMSVSLDEFDLSDMTKWEEVVSEENATLENFSIIGGKLILTYMDRAYSKMEILDPKTNQRKRVFLPSIGSVYGISGDVDQSEMYYSFGSFTVPTTIYKLDVNTLKQQKIEQVETGEDLTDIVTEQVVYPSKDGTEVTMFIVHKTGVEKNGENKVLLTGYGGFGVNETPAFVGGMVPWLQKGGIYAIPNLRGGGEYGEDWHRAGMLNNKQNVFDDFIAAAEYLIEESYTKPGKLAIRGGSNGGLLVGAALIQRPDLFGSVICDVPLLDMIHYDNLKIAKLWVSEYGDPNKPEDFAYLYTLSPYHNIKDGVAYPAVLLTTAEGDSRVDEMHAEKMAAKLQRATTSYKPVLLKVEKKAGHGAGKPISQWLEETTDVYAFLDSTLEK